MYDAFGPDGFGQEKGRSPKSDPLTVHLASIVIHSDDAIISKDLNGIITSWNHGAERIFGYSAAEVIGKPLSILAPSDRMHEMPEILARIRSGLSVNHYETKRKHKDGREIDISVTVSPIRDASGRVIGASKIARDITERKRAAELLNRAGSVLLSELDPRKLSQLITDLATELTGAAFGALFHKVVNELGEGFTLFAVSGASREVFSAFATPRYAALFAPTLRADGVLRSDDLTKDARYGQTMDQSEPLKDRLTVRSYLAVPIVVRSGEVLGGIFFGHPETGVFDERHEHIAAGIAAQAAVALDNARLFTEKQRTQEALQRANQKLRNANADLEQFAYSASHDLQEPIRNLATFAEMLQERYAQALDETGRESLNFMIEGAHRIEMLVQDLLAYARTGSALDQAAEATDANEALSKALANLSEAIKESEAEVVHEHLPQLRMYEVHLQQLFQNLVGNAIKYRSAAAPRVSILAEPFEGHWRFAVRDNGIGIGPEYHDRIFGVFKRLHSASEYPGTGIGLAICKRLVERYGGRIWVESEPGKGCTFFFTLPDAGKPAT